MLKRLLGALWRRAPVCVRRWGVRLFEPRFTVTAGAVVTNEQGRVLLLKHFWRAGSGWGIPGGFMEKGEQPEEALRRELREEIGLELESAELAFVRTLVGLRQVEVIFRCRPAGPLGERNSEIKSADWYALDQFPAALSRDQRKIIARALGNGAKRPD